MRTAAENLRRCRMILLNIDVDKIPGLDLYARFLKKDIARWSKEILAAAESCELAETLKTEPEKGAETW